MNKGPSNKIKNVKCQTEENETANNMLEGGWNHGNIMMVGGF